MCSVILLITAICTDIKEFGLRLVVLYAVISSDAENQ